LRRRLRAVPVSFAAVAVVVREVGEAARRGADSGGGWARALARRGGGAGAGAGGRR
jgi:hypothetical protein